MADKVEIDAQTGVIVERDFTSEEAEQAELDRLAYEKTEADKRAKAEADAAATAAAIAHAKSLGFTDAMIAVMYPNLGAQSE
jgi:hypothetical protein